MRSGRGKDRREGSTSSKKKIERDNRMRIKDDKERVHSGKHNRVKSRYEQNQFTRNKTKQEGKPTSTTYQESYRNQRPPKKSGRQTDQINTSTTVYRRNFGDPDTTDNKNKSSLHQHKKSRVETGHPGDHAIKSPHDFSPKARTEQSRPQHNYRNQKTTSGGTNNNKDNSRRGARTPAVKRPDDSKPKLTNLEVYLNIYKLDLLLPVNAYHSAIEIAGLEYAYGANVGVYACQPGEGYGARNMLLKEKKLLGHVKTSSEDIYQLMRTLARSEYYAPRSYDLLNRNCNDFTEDCAHILKVKGQQPYYVNALARSGRFLGCIRNTPGINSSIGSNRMRNNSWLQAFCS